MRFGTYIILEFKRISVCILKTLTGAVILAIAAGIIAFCTQKALLKNNDFEKIKIGMVVEGDSSVMAPALDFLQKMDSVKVSCEFIDLDEDEARQQLDEGSLEAVMYIPGTLVEDIISGANTPVKIIFGKIDQLSAALLQTLTQAGAGILSAAQAGIYTIYDCYIECGLEQFLQQAWDALNAAYLDLALNRGHIFQREIVSAYGAVSQRIYAGAAAAVILTMILAAAGSAALDGEKISVREKLKIYGISECRNLLIQYGCIFAIMWMILTVFYTTVFVAVQNPLGLSCGDIWVCLIKCFLWSVVTAFFSGMTVSALMIMAEALVRSRGARVMLMFALTAACLITAGALIPSGLLPQNLWLAGKFLPGQSIMQLIEGAASGWFQARAAGQLGIFSVVFLGIAALGTHWTGVDSK